MELHPDTAIIGAGPYGLSLAAHLRADHTDFVIIGRPMDAWMNHMPEGMLLKSDGFASNLYDPAGELTLAKFCQERGIEYRDTFIPVRLETFVNYGLAFAKRFAPELKNALVVSLARAPGGFKLITDDGDVVIARRVVVASGVGPFQYTPPQLSGLDKAHASHSYDHHKLSGFANRRVAVIGGGSSAIDLAGLLRDHGCESHLICRRERLIFSRSLTLGLGRSGSAFGPRVPASVPAGVRAFPPTRRSCSTPCRRRCGCRSSNAIWGQPQAGT